MMDSAAAIRHEHVAYGQLSNGGRQLSGAGALPLPPHPPMALALLSSARLYWHARPS